MSKYQTIATAWICAILLQGYFNSVGSYSWHDDLFYFTSFRNVSEWSELYSQCNIEYNYSEQKIMKEDRIPHTLSPIALPAPKDTTQVDRREEPHVLVIYNHPPPETSDYTVSFGFQKNKKCLVAGSTGECYVSPSFGQIRGVVLNAERLPLDLIREEFEVEEDEKFVTILNGGSKSERKFHEALFLGAKHGSNGERSSHTIDGKSYPMEIYMFFVDETYPSMSSTTILVVLVEEGAEDNPLVRPVANAVSYHLYEEERRFLKQHEETTQQTKMYHHLESSTYTYPDGTSNITLPPSWEIERNFFNTLEYWEKVLTQSDRQKLFTEDIKETEDQEREISETLADNPYTGMPPYDESFEFAIQGFFDAVINQEITREHLELECELNLIDLLVDKFFKAVDNSFRERFVMGNEMSTLDKIIQLRKSEEKLRTEILENIFREMERKPCEWRFKENERPDLIERYKIHESIFGYIDARDQLEKEIAKGNLRQGWVFEDNSNNQSAAKLSAEQIRDVQEELSHFRARKDVLSPPSTEKSISTSSTHGVLKRTGPIQSGNMGLSDKENMEFENRQPIKIKLLQKFQVSWLLPDGGGYYIYTGSSPVPPCFQAEKTIVFRKPIKMSKDQIESLTVMPSSFHKMKDIRNTLPRLHRLRRPNFPVYFEKRNHQFLLDDGVHSNSVIKAAQRRAASASPRPRPAVYIHLAYALLSVSFSGIF